MTAPRPASAKLQGSGINAKTSPLYPAAPRVSATGVVGGLAFGLPVAFDQANAPPLQVEPLQANRPVPAMKAEFQSVAVPVQPTTITSVFAPPVAVPNVNVVAGVHPAIVVIWCSGVVDDSVHAAGIREPPPVKNGDAVPTEA